MSEPLAKVQPWASHGMGFKNATDVLVLNIFIHVICTFQSRMLLCNFCFAAKRSRPDFIAAAHSVSAAFAESSRHATANVAAENCLFVVQEVQSCISLEY